MYNSSSTTYSTMLDTDRYYNASLRGPEAGSNVPKIKISYSVKLEKE